VCDRGAVLAHERVVEYLPASDVFANPPDPYSKVLVARSTGAQLEFCGGVPITMIR